MKRIVSFILAFVLVLSCVPAATAESGSAPRFVVDTVEAEPGSTVNVALRVENSPGIMSAKFIVTFGDGLTRLAAPLPQLP